METDITITNLQKRIPINSSRITKAAKKILKLQSIQSARLSVVFVGDRKIKELNKKYLKRGYATDVLAFDLKGKAGRPKDILGEVVISVDTVLRNAKIFKAKPYDELLLCLAHGILHLSGFDDHRAGDVKRMRRREAELLRIVTP